MDTKLNLDNFNIRRIQPYNAGIINLSEKEERYITKAQGLTGFEIFAGDKITIKNIEGKQTCEVVVFNNNGQSSPTLINHQSNGDAKFIKYILTNAHDKNFLLNKLSKRKIESNITI